MSFPPLGERPLPSGSVLGVDLAAEFTAGVVKHQGSVILEFDSKMGGVRELVDIIHQCHMRGAVCYIEDIPPNVAFTLSTKNVCKIQGRLEERIGKSLNLRFLNPLLWLRHFGWVNKMTSGSVDSFAKAKCIELQYTPPEHSRGSKLLTDYRAAFLIATYGEDQCAETTKSTRIS